MDFSAPGHERDAFRLVYRRRLENLGLKLSSKGQDVEAQGQLQSNWPAQVKAELMVKEISQLHQERKELHQQRRLVQKRTEAQLAGSQLEAAKHGTKQTRERRDGLKKLLTGASLLSPGDLLQAEQTLTMKVETLRKQTQELAERRQDLYAEVQQGYSSQAQLQSLVTSDLRHAAAQQANLGAVQVELKLWRDKLRMSELEREELHGKHMKVASQFQTALTSARKEEDEVNDSSLKQQLQQEEDAADCLGEAADRVQVKLNAVQDQLRRRHVVDSPQTLSKVAPPTKEAREDELKQRLSSSLQQIDELKQQVRDVKEQRGQLDFSLKCQRCKHEVHQVSQQLKEWHMALREAVCRPAVKSPDLREEMDKMKRLLGPPGMLSLSQLSRRVLEAFNEEVPCHSVDLLSLLMGSDDGYVVSAVTQLIQAEVKRQTAAIHSSLLHTSRDGMGELVGRLQELQKRLLEVVSSNEDEDDEIRDLELQLALLVGRRDEVLQASQVTPGVESKEEKCTG